MTDAPTRSLTMIQPLLVVRDARAAIDFYTRVFGATEQWRLMHYHRVGAEDQWRGVRGGAFRDPFDHRWSVHTILEPMSIEEMRRRSDALDLYPPPPASPAPPA